MCRPIWPISGFPIGARIGLRFGRFGSITLHTTKRFYYSESKHVRILPYLAYKFYEMDVLDTCGAMEFPAVTFSVAETNTEQKHIQAETSQVGCARFEIRGEKLPDEAATANNKALICVKIDPPYDPSDVANGALTECSACNCYSSINSI
jgi:hypothetical protein